MPHELKQWGIDKLRKWWDKFNADFVYDYESHVQLLKDIDEAGKLSKTFTTLPLRSNSDFVWNDVNRMHGLNMEQSRRKLQNHICPMPFDQVDRLIKLYSMPGELIADPFNGLGTTGVRALKAGRRYFGTELNDVYAKTAAMYLREQENKADLPTLFDEVA
jgi:DNA modification methylase